MNKELLIAFIQKDLKELGVMLDGLSEMETFPLPIANLAISKAESVAECLRQLSMINETGKANANEKETVENPNPEIVEEWKSDSNEEVSVKENIEPIVTEHDEKTDVVETDEAVAEKDSAVFEPQKRMGSDVVLTVADSLTGSASLNETIATEENTVGASIAHQKVADLNQAISIGDRFRFQRELFAGQGEKMNRALSDLNAAASMDEALRYLTERLSWNLDDEPVLNFIELLKRKFA